MLQTISLTYLPCTDIVTCRRSGISDLSNKPAFCKHSIGFIAEYEGERIGVMYHSLAKIEYIKYGSKYFVFKEFNQINTNVSFFDISVLEMLESDKSMGIPRQFIIHNHSKDMFEKESKWNKITPELLGKFIHFDKNKGMLIEPNKMLRLEYEEDFRD